MLVVALLGIPLLIGTWYAVRAFANVERGVASALLDEHVAPAADGGRRQRQPVGAASRHEPRPRPLARARLPDAALPRRHRHLHARRHRAHGAGDDRLHADLRPLRRRPTSFGDWFWSTELQDFASSNPWSWALLPAGLLLAVRRLPRTQRARSRLRTVDGGVAGRRELSRVGRTRLSPRLPPRPIVGYAAVTPSVGWQEAVGEDLLALLAEDEVDEGFRVGCLLGVAIGYSASTLMSAGISTPSA